MNNKILKLLMFIAIFGIAASTIALLATLASTAISAKNTSDTNKRRRRAIRDQLANQETFGRRAQEKISGTIDRFKPEERVADLEARDVENLDILNRVSAANEPSRTERPDVSGKLSSAFEGESAKRRAGTAEKALGRNLNLARFFAPRQTAGIDDPGKLSTLSNALRTVRGNQRGQTFADQQKINSVVRHGGLDLLSGILKGVGAVAGGFGGTTAATTGTVAPLAASVGAGALRANANPNFIFDVSKFAK